MNCDIPVVAEKLIGIQHHDPFVRAMFERKISQIVFAGLVEVLVMLNYFDAWICLGESMRYIASAVCAERVENDYFVRVW